MKTKPELKKSRVTMWTIAVLFLSIVGATYFTSYEVGRMAENDAKESVGISLSELAYQMSDKADRGIDERLRDVKSTIGSSALTSIGSSVAVKQRAVDNIGKTYDQYSFVAATDTLGNVIASKDGLLLGKNVSARPWFQHAIALEEGNLTVEDVHEALLLAKLLPRRADGEPLRFVDVAGPLYDNGQLQGVFGVHLSFAWIDSIRTDLLEPHQISESIEIILLDKDNKVLLGPDSLKIGQDISLQATTAAKKGVKGSTVEMWPDGKQYVTGYFGSRGFANYKGLGWKVLVRQPTTVAFAQIQQESQTIRLSGIALGTLVALIATALLWRILRSERQLEVARNNFVSIASHQLRTPATAVKQNLGLIVEGYATKEADKKRFIHAAYESNEYQLAIIEDILNTARIESGTLKLNKESIDMTQLLKSVIEEQVGTLKKDQKLVEHLPNDSIMASVDKTKIKMSVGNLLSNAIKYTDVGGEVTISLETQKAKVVVTVADTGVGVAKADIPKLFTKFGRIDNALSMKVSGTGLGLYLVKEIVTLHNGEMRVESKLNEGTQFIMELPKE